MLDSVDASQEAAMDFSPFSLLVVKVFSLITGGLGAEACAQILKVPLEELEPIIADLKEGGQLQSDPDRPARIMITSRGVAELQMRNAWREVCAEIADVASALDEGQNLEACTLLLGFINTLLNSSQSSGAVACYGLVLRLLGRWSPAGAASGQKQAFMKLALAACDISMYLSKSHRQAREIAARALETAKEQGDARMTALLHLVESSLENMAAECSAQRMHELHAQCETSLLELDKAGARGQAEYFVGMFHFWHGHFREALAAFEVALQYPQLWECRFQTEMFSLYTSSSAVYLGRFHQAVGILEAAKRAAELGQNRFKILWWEGQLAMVLLYMRRHEEALELIDHVLSMVNPETETKIAVWGMRGLAFYHYTQGNIKASHAAMQRTMDIALRYGFRRPIYSYPWMFDVLAAYEQAGLPPVRGLDLDEEIQRAIESYNEHLRAGALRAKATRLFAESGDKEAAGSLLAESLRGFTAIGNPTEIAVTQRRIARLHDLPARAAERGLAPESGASPYEPESTARIGGTLLENCRIALESIRNLTDFSQYINQMTHIAGCELGAERAALLEVSSGGLLTCRAACNISAVELNTGKISSKVSQIYAVQQNKPLLLDEERHVFLSLPLETAKARWVLWLESEYALETLRGISNADQAAFTLLFESELRKIEAGKPKPARLAAGEQEQAQAEPYRDTPEILLHGSAIMRRLLSHGRQIGATDAPVLILGETGVGKELLAHYIHDCSGRTGPFVPVHPASIPDGLFESEFFGHEKGAFTGAIRQKIGLAEMAHQGTLFIDEAGDIPAPMQIKLLRVFQDHRFMRVGGEEERHSDFRLICATNKDLWAEVKSGHFREDLYYRLSVVPLTIPPLRSRKEDIRLLVRFFLDRYSRRYHRDIQQPSERELEALLQYDWPGNIRELKSVLERTVILHQGDRLSFDLSSHAESKADGTPRQEPCEELFKNLPTLDELQSRYIQHVLKITNGRITGNRGALRILGMKRSTLYLRLKQYNIRF